MLVETRKTAPAKERMQRNKMRMGIGWPEEAPANFSQAPDREFASAGHSFNSNTNSNPNPPGNLLDVVSRGFESVVTEM